MPAPPPDATTDATTGTPRRAPQRDQRHTPGRLRLGLNLGYWGAGDDADNLLLAQEADRLGYSVAWAAEAYGSDAVTVLSWVAARTERIDVGSAVLQIPARTPAMTAMTAATLDTLSGGRFRLGLGVSGPQVSEGWHGVRFDHPLGRTREYVDIVRMALRGETVRYDGTHFTLPLPDGPGKAIKLTVRPAREQLPIYLAAVGPKNLELAGRIADGWLGVFFSPEHAAVSMDPLRRGRVAAGHVDDPMAGFDVVTTVPVVIDDDLERAAAPVRGYAALYVGGMGSRDQNFYNALARRMGFEADAERVQRLFLDRKHREAAAAVPLDFIDRTSLIGPRERIRDRLHAYAEAGVTTVSVAALDGDLARRLHTIRTVAQVLDESGLSG